MADFLIYNTDYFGIGICINRFYRYLLLLLFWWCHFGGRCSCHYLFLVWLKVWHRTKRGKDVGRCFAAVTEVLGELFHNTETSISDILIKLCHLYLGFVCSQEREQGETYNGDIAGVCVCCLVSFLKYGWKYES